MTKFEEINVEEILEMNEISFAVSKVIKIYRVKEKLTQRQLAKKLNISHNMISKLENGKYNPTLKTLHKISRKLTGSTELFIEFVDTIKEQLLDMYK